MTDPDPSDPDIPADPPAGSRAEHGAGRLLNRDFFLLWQGQLVSELGNQVFLVAMLFGTMELTGSSSIMGLLMMLTSLPGLILGPLGGTFADRHSRRTIIIGSDLVLGLALLGLAAVVWWQPDSTTLGLVGLSVVAVLTGVLGSLFRPAITAAIPDLVPRHRISAANSLRQLSNQVSVTVGRAVGGVLYNTLGVALLFLIDGLSYLFSAVSEAFIRIPQKLPDHPPGPLRDTLESYWRSTLEGLRYVWDQPGMRNFILMVAALNFFFMPVFVLLPFYVDLYLGQEADAYGFIMAGFSAGAFAGSVLAGSLRLGGEARGRVMLWCLGTTSVSFLVLAYGRDLWLAVGTFVVIGLAVSLINVYVITLLQMMTPEELRGRVLGLEMALTRVASPLGMGLGGVLGDLTDQNLPLLYSICGGAPLLITLVMSRQRQLRAFLSWEEPAEGPAEDGAPIAP